MATLIQRILQVVLVIMIGTIVVLIGEARLGQTSGRETDPPASERPEKPTGPQRVELQSPRHAVPTSDAPRRRSEEPEVDHPGAGTSQEWVDASGSGSSSSTDLLTPQEAVARIQGGAPALVIFFAPGCSLSQRAFPQFVQLASKYGDRVSILAFSTDTHEANVTEFLFSNGASFRAELLEGWQPGEFTSALATGGLHAGKTWTTPLVAVIDRDGQVLGQWQGITKLGPVEAALMRLGS